MLCTRALKNIRVPMRETPRLGIQNSLWTSARVSYGIKRVRAPLQAKAGMWRMLLGRVHYNEGKLQ